MPPQYWDSIVLTYDAYLAEEAGERALADMFREADSQGDSFDVFYDGGPRACRAKAERA